MKPSELNKLNDLIERIESGIFDCNSVDSVFIKMREFSGKNNLFKEVANFIAHNKERDEGIISEHTTANFLKFKFILSKEMKGQQLDVVKGFPAWIYSLVMIQISELDEGECKSKYNKTKSGLRERVRQMFTVKDGICKVKGEIKRNDFNTFTSLLDSFTIRGEGVFTIDDLFDEMVLCLKQNNISFSDEKLREQKDKIILSIFLLMHNTEFKFKQTLSARIVITADNNEMSIAAKIPLDGIYFSYIILKTELDISEWCDEQAIDYLTTHNELPESIKINNDFKLSLI
ncbi:hypothetical protein FCG74_007570 [Klebsiella pneumoniae]|uniref:hypothetical protein n=1 Tax=Klebsiella pneumoniae TaxID=573 RepID=UPI0011441786|nr:hypothetical protein [Klebsiella pneumoniae]TYX08438.1 hypothetical protein FCG74_007570 [Klebsiella pneumoniae]